MKRNLQDLDTNYNIIDYIYSRLKEEIKEQPDCEKPLINKLKKNSKRFKKKKLDILKRKFK